VNRLVAYLIRFAVILIGYAVASLAASAFINIIFLASAGFTPEQAAPATMNALVFSIPFVALFVAYFAFMPAVVVILVSELLDRRDWLFYALGGGVVAAIFLGFVDRSADVSFAITEPFAIATVIGGGMVGGIFYWFSAGRWTGSWRREAVLDPEP
jgi:hypothetical protein